MTQAEKIAMVQTLVGNDTEATTALVTVYLSLSSDAIIKRCYPFGDGTETLPTKYEILQCNLASRYFLRRGAEGETAHTESGVSRTYGSVNDEDLLSTVIPFAKLGGIVEEDEDEEEEDE